MCNNIVHLLYTSSLHFFLFPRRTRAARLFQARLFAPILFLLFCTSFVHLPMHSARGISPRGERNIFQVKPLEGYSLHFSGALNRASVQLIHLAAFSRARWQHILVYHPLPCHTCPPV